MKTLITKAHFDSLASININQWHIIYYTQKASYKETPNEDSLLIQAISNDIVCLAIADGVGSTKESFKASSGVLDRVAQSIQSLKNHNDIRASILETLETTNQLMLKRNDPATTLTLAILIKDKIQIFQIGDSGLFICGQRGKLKYRTITHSPTGHAVAAGLMSEKEAQLHPDNPIVDNVMGFQGMHVDISSPVTLDPYDSVFLASDGIFDNYTTDTLTNIIRKRHPETEITKKIIKPIQTLYQHDTPPSIHKDDDISFIVAQRLS